MKKMITFLLSITLMFVAFFMTAFAQERLNHRGNDPYCIMGKCNISGTHKHRGSYGTKHTKNRSQEYYEICPFQNCIKITTHVHGDNMYYGQRNEDGHTYHNGGSHGHNKSQHH